MDLLQDIYHTHPGFCNAAIALLIFGGMGRIAFWRDQDGLRVGGMLATGLALLLSVALLIWADEHHRCIQEFGHMRAAHMPDYAEHVNMLSSWAEVPSLTRHFAQTAQHNLPASELFESFDQVVVAFPSGLIALWPHNHSFGRF